MNQNIDRPADIHRDRHASTIVFEGYIGEMNDEKVVIFPWLDRRYSIELRRKDVLDFEAGLASGACRFVVSSHAPVQERLTVLTTARRARTAGDVSGLSMPPETGGADLHDWMDEGDWDRPD